jgi:ferredoxin
VHYYGQKRYKQFCRAWRQKELKPSLPNWRMAKVYIVNDGKWIDVADGSKLIALQNQCSILFACGEGVCGSCLAKITEGEGNLGQPTEYEKQMLQNFGAKPGQRLLCQAVIKSGEAKIEQ